MTGDAVNDAAALKQADIGVAMGSGSEVTKQAAKIVLTDDNFATLVRAVDLGRDIYRRITSYVKLQLTILSSVLQLMLLATIFNINGGVALFPMQLLFCKFFVVVTVVIGFIVDVPDPSVMQRPPRKPGTRIVTRPQIVRWAVTASWSPSAPFPSWCGGRTSRAPHTPSISMTMAFAVVALSAVNLGVVMRREREPVWSSPIFPYMGWIILGWAAHLGGRRARHAAAAARHDVAHRHAVGPGAAAVDHHAPDRLGGQDHPAVARAEGGEGPAGRFDRVGRACPAPGADDRG